LVAKVSERAQRHRRVPSHAAIVFLEVYHRAHRQTGVRDGTAYLLSAFEREIAKDA